MLLARSADFNLRSLYNASISSAGHADYRLLSNSPAFQRTELRLQPVILSESLSRKAATGMC